MTSARQNAELALRACRPLTTRAQLLKAAREKWGKKTAVSIDTSAPNAVDRRKATAAIQSLKKERDEYKAERRVINFNDAALRRLAKQARFAIDVEGGDPSIVELADALEPLERRLELDDMIREVDESLKRIRRKYRLDRYAVSVHEDDTIGGGFGLRMIHVQADSIDEAMRKLKASKH